MVEDCYASRRTTMIGIYCWNHYKQPTMKLIRKNKQAYFDYEIVDTVEAGIVLQWHEVKSIKTGHPNITDAVVQIQWRELWVVNMDIPLYKKSAPTTTLGYEPKQKRKLLITRKQLTKLYERTKKTGLAMMPLQLLENNRWQIKVLVGLGKLKKKIEKRAIIQERQTKRTVDRELKEYNK